jgi:uncharacterized protein YjbJ (UPF0337 family)
MNRDTVKGGWRQLKGKLRRRWGKLTNDNMDQIRGNAEILLGKLQTNYGRSREEIERELNRRLAQWRQFRHLRKAS